MSRISNSILSTIQKLKSRYSIQSQQNRVIQASNLLQAIKHQAHDSKWYMDDVTPSSSSLSNHKISKQKQQYKVKPDFRQIHAMLSMHLWFINHRLHTHNQSLQENDIQKHNNLLLQEELFDMFWTDTTSRIRAYDGIHEMMVNKHLKDAQRATLTHCIHYDHAFDTFPHDVEKRFELIYEAVWVHVFAGEKDVNQDLIRKISAYVEYQRANVVKKLPDEYFDEGRIAWGNIPEFGLDDNGDNNIEKEDSLDERDTKRLSGPLRGMTFLKDNWVQILSTAGKPYYWNMDTDETRWDRP